MNSENNNLTWQERLRYEFRRNRKKSAMLTILLVVCVVMVARLAIKKSPSVAGGQSQAAVEPQAAPAGAAPLTAAGVQGTPAPAPGAMPTGVGRPRPLVPVKVEFIRDIFKPDPAAFTGHSEDEAPTPDDVRIQVRLEANALRLTSTMVGEVSCVTINGQLLRGNDWIEGFQVVGIGKGRCIVAKKGVRVQLDMEN
ncbi:MAG: hypothetical protein NTV86_21330 [Planctomycetota bacterium]|nr:hypothetical protein [Planctomycetota bacterium]